MPVARRLDHHLARPLEGILVKYGTVGLLAFAALTAATATSATAQANGQGQVYAARAQLEADRAQIVTDNLTLTSAEGTAFWPVYRAYRADMHKISDQAVALIDNFAKSYDQLTNEQATKMLNDWMSIETQRSALRASYLPKFLAVLPPPKCARYYQIENKLDAIVAYTAAGAVPLAMSPKAASATPAPAAKPTN
jgi:hypothetical protein